MVCFFFYYINSCKYGLINNLDINNSNQLNYSKNINLNILDSPNNASYFENIIVKLISYSKKTKRRNIIFADYYKSKTCYDKSAFTLFDYYIKNSIGIPFYIINNESDLFKSLFEQNKTKNLILYNENNLIEFYDDLYECLKNSKIIINSYSLPLLQLVSSYVPYIKYLKINHGIKHFKALIAQMEFIESLRNKANVICSSPFEYELLLKSLNYRDDQIYNASLVRYERFQFIKPDESEKKCILASFTYRRYTKEVFEKSEYKKNLEKLLNDKDLIINLKGKNIDLIYIPHHEEIQLGKNYSQFNYNYAKIKNQSNLEHYIEQCSLLITDFSSISFDFMFQNKPVLFYPIDKNENFTFFEKKFVENTNDTLYFGNYFSKQNLLINKIKYYIDKNLTIENQLKQKYESLFYFKKNIITKIIEIIDKIANDEKKLL